MISARKTGVVARRTEAFRETRLMRRSFMPRSGLGKLAVLLVAVLAAVWVFVATGPVQGILQYLRGHTHRDAVVLENLTRSLIDSVKDRKWENLRLDRFELQFEQGQSAAWAEVGYSYRVSGRECRVQFPTRFVRSELRRKSGGTSFVWTLESIGVADPGAENGDNTKVGLSPECPSPESSAGKMKENSASEGAGLSGGLAKCKWIPATQPLAMRILRGCSS